jgi:N-acyl-D-amino-acid deacylase
MYDLIIRNGTIVDGSGLPAYQADSPSPDGRIVKLGHIDGPARKHRCRRQSGAPGFIDPHTHFDAQLLWDGYAKPALSHGVTTIVPGNCSLSLAPLKAEHRMRLVGMFNQIEEMPYKAFRKAWSGTGKPSTSTCTASARASPSMSRPWSATACCACGSWARRHPTARTATDDEIAAMQDLLRQCLDAGAWGFPPASSTWTRPCSRCRAAMPMAASWTPWPGARRVRTHAADRAGILRRGPDHRPHRPARRAVPGPRIPTTFSPLFVTADNADAVERVMARVDEQFARGARVWPQVQTRPIDISFCFAVPSLLFIRLPGWYRLMRFGTHDEIVAAFRDPATAPAAGATKPLRWRLWPHLVLRQVPPTPISRWWARPWARSPSCADHAGRRDDRPVALEEDLQAHFLAANMGHNDDDRVGGAAQPPAGAHRRQRRRRAHSVLLHLWRHRLPVQPLRARAPRHGLEAAVKKITSDTAAIWGIPERGLLQKGYVADITVFDAAPSTAAPSTTSRTCPATAAATCAIGGRRYGDRQRRRRLECRGRLRQDTRGASPAGPGRGHPPAGRA